MINPFQNNKYKLINNNNILLLIQDQINNNKRLFSNNNNNKLIKSFKRKSDYFYISINKIIITLLH